MKKKPKSDKRYIPFDATMAITIHVRPEHCTNAVCKDGENCVIAKAMWDHFGETLDKFEVGSTITKLYMSDGRVLRFTTPAVLRPYIRHFDLTGKWDLPEGSYTFTPPSKTAKLGGRPNRWAKHRHTVKRSGQDAFKPRAIPSRRVSRVSSFVTVA